MSPDAEVVHLNLRLDTAHDADAEELDRLTRQLLGEIRELEVESAELVTAGAAPEGTRSAEVVTMGALAVAVLPTVLPKLIELVQAWIMRGQGRTVKFKGRLGIGEIEIEGATPAELKALLAALSTSQPVGGEPTEKSE